MGGRPCFSADSISREFSKYREVRWLLGNQKTSPVRAFTAPQTSQSGLHWPPPPFFHCSPAYVMYPILQTWTTKRSLVAPTHSNGHFPCWPLSFSEGQAPSSGSHLTLLLFSLSCLLCKITPYQNCDTGSVRLSLKASSLLHSDLVAGDSHSSLSFQTSSPTGLFGITLNVSKAIRHTVSSIYRPTEKRHRKCR